jgi:hypothetical protein
MKHLTLDQLAATGGEGRKLLANAKRIALSTQEENWVASTNMIRVLLVALITGCYERLFVVDGGITNGWLSLPPIKRGRLLDDHFVVFRVSIIKMIIRWNGLTRSQLTVERWRDPYLATWKDVTWLISTGPLYSRPRVWKPGRHEFLVSPEGISGRRFC